jgi:hypothetical protein
MNPHRRGLDIYEFCWQIKLIGMPRQLRIEYPGVIYHLMNRGRAFSAGRDAPALRQARTPAAASAPRPHSNFEDTL